MCANGSSRAPNLLRVRRTPLATARTTVLAGEQGDDPVGLAELVLAQHHRSIPVQPHRHSLPPRSDNTGDTISPDILGSTIELPSYSIKPKKKKTRHPFPTLTQQLYQLANGAVTSAELAPPMLRAIDGQPVHAQRFPGGADRIGPRRSRSPPTADAPRRATFRCSAFRSPSRTTSTSPACQRSFGTAGDIPARQRRLRGRAQAARGRRGHRRQDEHLRVRSVAVHQWTGLGPHLQSMVTQAHPGRVVGRQRSGGRRRAGGRGDRVGRRRQRPDLRGVDSPGRHQTAARAHLHLAAARGVQRHHRQRGVGAHGH